MSPSSGSSLSLIGAKFSSGVPRILELTLANSYLLSSVLVASPDPWGRSQSSARSLGFSTLAGDVVNADLSCKCKPRKESSEFCTDNLTDHRCILYHFELLMLGSFLYQIYVHSFFRLCKGPLSDQQKSALFYWK